MMDEADKTALADAMEKMCEAFKKDDYDAAAEAFLDADSITDKQTGEGEPDEDDKGKPKEKRSLAAILIGGPAKK